VKGGHQLEPGVYARALEKIYQDNLVSAVATSNSQAHPHLYDRMLAAGIQPEYPRPTKPSAMAWPSVLMWVAYAMVKQPRRSAEGNLVYTLEAATAEQLLAEVKAKGIVEL